MKNYKTLVLSLVVLIGLILAAIIPYGNVLAITSEDSGKVIVYVNVEQNKKFQIRYTHSVHQTPVLETYRISNNNEIVQTELAYENFAIGMPSNAIGQETFIEKDGTYYIKNMNRRFPYIDIRIGQVIAEHTLIINEKQLPFEQIVEPGSWVRLRVQPLNLWERLKGDEILG